MFKYIVDFFDSISEHTKHVIDWTSIGIALGSLIQVLPSIAAALSIVWSVIRIYETKTIQGWIKKWTKPNA
jgi:DMSO reductase anchor subunit